VSTKRVTKTVFLPIAGPLPESGIGGVNTVRLDQPARTEPAPGSTRELARVALPLVISAGSLSLMYFVDRVFLTWHSLDAVAAAMSGCVLHFALCSLFLGTLHYINTFVAQYEGAGNPGRVGAALWQGIYLALGASLFVAAIGPLAGRLFDWLGHDLSLRPLEAQYFSLLCYGSAALFLQIPLACFYSGRGRTQVIMWVNLTSMLVNAVLDYVLIFGFGPVPALGIAGAALGTVLANVVALGLYAAAIWCWADARRYSLLSAWRLDSELLSRMLRFGLPNGAHLFLDVICWTLFIHLTGLMGTEHLAATTLAFNVNNLAFVPMLGIGTAISTLTGQRIGEGKPHLAVRTTQTAFGWTSVYMLVCGAAFVLAPELILLPYKLGLEKPDDFAAVHDQVVLLLRFVAVYSWFDAMTIVFGSSIRGAGDTRFSLVLTAGSGWLLMVVPTWLAWRHTSDPMFWAWTAATANVIFLGIGFLVRFRGGRWQSMRVIEQELAPEIDLPAIPA
jgi:MATE family multidrug resistance protein